MCHSLINSHEFCRKKRNRGKYIGRSTLTYSHLSIPNILQQNLPWIFVPSYLQLSDNMKRIMVSRKRFGVINKNSCDKIKSNLRYQIIYLEQSTSKSIIHLFHDLKLQTAVISCCCDQESNSKPSFQFPKFNL